MHTIQQKYVFMELCVFCSSVWFWRDWEAPGGSKYNAGRFRHSRGRNDTSHTSESQKLHDVFEFRCAGVEPKVLQVHSRLSQRHFCFRFQYFQARKVANFPTICSVNIFQQSTVVSIIFKDDRHGSVITFPGDFASLMAIGRQGCCLFGVSYASQSENSMMAASEFEHSRICLI